MCLNYTIFSSMKVNGIELNLSRPAVMAIINVTPDSFYAASRRGVATDDEIACAVDTAVADSATIIDIGGYSSRPGADDVSAGEERRRVARGLRIVRERHPDVAVSIDTFRAEVAARTIEEFGACIVNDISAGELDPDMVATVAGLGVPYIAMHMRANPATMQQHTGYDDITAAVKEYFARKVEELASAGISDIIIDPGFGFAKTARQNYELLGRLNELRCFGLPILSGVSRKSMIYKLLGATPAEALAGTCALNWESLRQGASIIRVHDVREAAQIVRMFDFYTGSQLVVPDENA